MSFYPKYDFGINHFFLLQFLNSLWSFCLTGGLAIASQHQVLQLALILPIAENFTPRVMNLCNLVSLSKPGDNFNCSTFHFYYCTSTISHPLLHFFYCTLTFALLLLRFFYCTYYYFTSTVALLLLHFCYCASTLAHTHSRFLLPLP